MRKFVQTLVALCAMTFAGGNVSAATPFAPPEPLPQSVLDAAPESNFQLLGYGRFRKLLWDVFDASLWVQGDDWRLEEPFALELRYVRDIDGEDIVDSTRDQLKQVGYSDPSLVEPWIEQLRTIFPDVKNGDRLVGLQLPGQPTQFFHNGRPIGSVTDPAFGPAFFAIWLGPKTSQPALRNELLGSGCAKPATVARTEVKPCGGVTMPESSTRRPGMRQP
jgi:hypothetical protein